eukprot:gene12154-8696_t
MLSTAINLPTRRSYVFENSRYNPVIGFSTRGLLPTDRKALSNRDGTDGYASLDEASEVLLSKGWLWDPESTWDVEMNLTDVDAEGFSYSVDFQHFVGDNAPDAPMTCGGERKINALKNEMMDVLQLSTSPATATANKTAPSTTSPSPAMTPYFSTKTSDILDSFISSCRTTLAMASSVFRSGDAADNFTQRQQDVARYFAMEERVEWAKLVLRKHDVEYNFHCSVRNCGPSCIFAVESCPNVGCCVYFSRKWAEAHDAVCPEKILGCPRTCGECLQRKRMDMHLRDDCILRPITCTYHSVGCKHDLVFKDLEHHLQTETQHHMSLMFTRLMEQQTVIQSLHLKIHALETSRQEQQQEIVSLTAALGVATVALKTSEARQDKMLRDEIQRIDNKYNRQVSGLQTDISQIRGVLPRK